jgi:hypothetical protein
MSRILIYYFLNYGILKYIREQRIKWWRHLNRMEKTKTTREIREWNTIGMRSKGRPKNRWKVKC